MTARSVLAVSPVIDTPLFQARTSRAKLQLIEWMVLPDGSVTLVLQSPDGRQLVRRGRDLLPLTRSARDVLTLGSELRSTLLWRWMLRGGCLHGVGDGFGSA